MVMRFVEEDEELKATMRAEAEQQKRNMDWLGIALLWLSLICMQYVLEEGQADDWFESPTILALTLAAVFGSAMFVVRELTAISPAVNLRLFADRTFASGAIVNSAVFAVLMAGMFLLPLFMQELLGFTATQSGMALMPRTLVMMLAMPIVGRLYNRFSPALFAGVGLVLAAAGQWTLSVANLDTSMAQVVYGIMLQGVGLAMILVPVGTRMLVTIPRHRLADATGLSSLLRQIGGSLGLAVFATLLSRYQVTASANLKAHLVLSRPEVAQRLHGAEHLLAAAGASPQVAHGTALRALAGTVARQGAVLAFDKMFLLGTLLFACVLPLLLLLRAARMDPAQAGPTEPAHVEIEV
jgi:DHA2 family multidrug resistance protein